jgi:hypothetical protein
LHFGLFWVRDLASGPLRLLHPQGQQQKPSAKSESDTSSFVSMLLEHCEQPRLAEESSANGHVPRIEIGTTSLWEARFL